MRPYRSVLILALCLLVAACEKSDPEQEKQRRQQQVDGLYLKATGEYLHGDLETALASYETVRQLAPEDPRLPAAMGEVYLSMGKHKEALAHFREAAHLDPKRSTNWSRIGFILLQQGERDEAKTVLERALSLDPHDFNSMENLGELAQREGRTDDAIGWLVRSAAEAPLPAKGPLLLRVVELLGKVGREGEAIPLLAARAADAQSAEVYTELGDLQVRAKDLPAAIESYRSAAQLAPRDPTLWELIAAIQLQQGKPGDALASYRESLRIQDRSVVHVELARLHLARKEQDAAKAELDLALATAKGDDPHESSELAGLLAQMGRKPDALKLLSLLASEEDAEKDVALQLRTAKLARELGDAKTTELACGRVKKADAKARCP